MSAGEPSRHRYRGAVATQRAVCRGADARGVAVGCGAIVLQPEFGEIKRMYVRPENRGGGIAMALLTRLEGEAIARDCLRFVLETGVSQPEALALYGRAGYVRCGPFGTYAEDPSACSCKRTRFSLPARTRPHGANSPGGGGRAGYHLPRSSLFPVRMFRTPPSLVPGKAAALPGFPACSAPWRWRSPAPPACRLPRWPTISAKSSTPCAWAGIP
ncbi:GNAT family N-acetyltransferase [Cupriavidus basilensis]